MTAQGVKPPPPAPSMLLTPPVSNNFPVSACAATPKNSAEAKAVALSPTKAVDVVLERCMLNVLSKFKKKVCLSFTRLLSVWIQQFANKSQRIFCVGDRGQ
jgi:hypothetical protein